MVGLSLLMRLTTVVSALSALGLATASSVKLFTLDLTVGNIAPDGTKRQAFLVNGQTPGPNLIIDQGDNVSVTIKNHLNVPTTVHFHGIDQSASIWSDGTPGVTQRMIQPGSTFIANWTATEHGLYWYHSHSRAIYGDGVRGGIFIRPNSKNLNNSPLSQISNDPLDLIALKLAHNNPKIVSLLDWTHWTSEKGLQQWDDSHVELLCVDSVLVNGKGRQICPDPSVFLPYITGNPLVSEVTAKGCAYPNNTVTQPFPGNKPELLDPSIFFECANTTTPFEVVDANPYSKWLSIAFINMAALWDFKVSIDDHPMWVYAADGQYHDVQKVDVLGIPIAERFQVMIKLDKPWSDYAIRVAITSVPQFMSGYATLSYKRTGGTGSHIPDPVKPALGYGGDTLPGFTELNSTTLQAFPPSLHPPQKADVTLIMDIIRANATTWVLNTDPFAAFLELEEPLLFDPNSTASLDPKLVLDYPVGSVVDVVFKAHPGNPTHPIHKHGVKAWVIGQGDGEWKWNSVAEAQKDVPNAFNLDRPPLRDGFETPLAAVDWAWLVIRYEVKQPGVIYLHCHVNTHAVSGMNVALIEGDPTTIDIPQYYRDFGGQPSQTGSQNKTSAAAPLPSGAGNGSHVSHTTRIRKRHAATVAKSRLSGHL
ncbi:hypothetical protein FRB99_008084 [Tulasnella sp. 403]|nr:hypothetical protein FRB99_008084 [Tulasnella sp. 403]